MLKQTIVDLSEKHVWADGQMFPQSHSDKPFLKSQIGKRRLRIGPYCGSFLKSCFPHIEEEKKHRDDRLPKPWLQTEVVHEVYILSYESMKGSY